jgi:alpha-tubulin suppressor-like RCC1 family protein
MAGRDGFAIQICQEGCQMRKTRKALAFVLVCLAAAALVGVSARASELEIEEPPKAVILASSPYRCTAAVDASGVLWMWGLHFNDDGKAAYTDIYADKPLRVLDEVESITGEFNEIHALRRDGTLWACSGQAENEWGDRERVVLQTPVKLLSAVKQSFPPEKDSWKPVYLRFLAQDQSALYCSL